MTNSFDGYLSQPEIVDVHVLVFDDNGRILRGRRSGTRYADGHWHLPSGNLETGESVTTAAIREAKEEIGVVIQAFNAFLWGIGCAGCRAKCTVKGNKTP